MLQLPTVTTASGDRTLRRLGLGDLEFARDLVESVLSTGEAFLAKFQVIDLRRPADLTAVILAGGKAAQAPLQRWIASLLRMTPEEVADPATFALPDLPKVINAMYAHPDATGFFEEASRLLTPLLALMERLVPGRSTASFNGTAGPKTIS
ncbi:MAG: hypothetical protein ACH37Z_11475 [Anaerolineae bacterium]